jgi:hypothetical protein
MGYGYRPNEEAGNTAWDAGASACGQLGKTLEAETLVAGWGCAKKG